MKSAKSSFQIFFGVNHVEYARIYIFNMNYLAQMLRDCSKNRSTSFTQLSFPIVQQIENKIKNKNVNLRKKMKQRLIDRQKISKVDDKKQQNGQLKKENPNHRQEKEIINYIEAYDDQKVFQQNKRNSIQLEEVTLDEKQSEATFNIYILMRKRKGIFKIEEVKRKLRNKQNLKRMSLKQCDCCERIGRHRCLHKYCEGKCQKNRKDQKVESIAAGAEQFDEQLSAVELAQQLIEEVVKQQEISLNVVRIIQKEEEALSIPKIDITQKQELMKEEGEPEILHQRQRISENQSKSDISESKRHRGSDFNKENNDEVQVQQQQQQRKTQNQNIEEDK